MARLVVLSGQSPEQHYELDASRLTIGRDGSNDIQLVDGTISRTHAALIRSGQSWRVSDLDSRNGTLLNDEPVHDASLRSGDLIRIGEALLVFIESTGDSPDAAPELATGTLTEFVSKEGGTTSADSIAYEAAGTRLHAMLALVDPSQRIDSPRDILSAALGDLERTLSPCRAHFFLRTEDGLLEPVQAIGHSHAEPKSGAVTQRVVQRVLQTGNAGLWRSDDDSSLFQTDSQTEVGSVLYGPVGGLARVRGVLYVEREFGRPDFSAEDLEFLVAFSCVLGSVVDNAEVRDELKRARQILRREVHSKYSIVGNSPSLRALFDLIGRGAKAEVTVLIQGESGTGKELVAHAIHQLSERHGERFEVVNCGLLAKDLAESELFGHKRGAFTSAHTARKGRFELAHKGVLFLDEIGELPLDCQAKLLRAVQFGEVHPVGAESNLEVDVRIIAATNRDLREEVAAGRFREDLYVRLNGLTIEVPPLRERREDIPLLAEHFLVGITRSTGVVIKGMTEGLEKALMAHSWPGNVRQLKNALESMAILARSEVLSLDDLPKEFRRDSDDSSAELHDFHPIPLDELVRRHVLATVEHAGGNKAKAARLLGIDRGTLYSKLRGYRRK